jgi:threonine/homoserine efflux transporter RhtA
MSEAQAPVDGELYAARQKIYPREIKGRFQQLRVYAVCALLGLVTEYVQRNRLGLITAATSGLALLLTAGRFGDDGDTMGVMVAVLDSNFWLATLVVCISIGYAGCCVAGSTTSTARMRTTGSTNFCPL